MTKRYTCPMHPEIVSDKPGKCPKCGGMDLVEMGKDDQMGEHDHSSMMGMPGVAESFLRRFYIVTVLLIPLLFLTKTSLNIFNIADFAARPYLQFGVSTAIFYFGLVFFEHAKHEIKAKKYGMMTLVSLAVGSGYLFSAASTFLPALDAEFYLEISSLIWILLFGHYLEAKSSTAAGDALGEVAKLLPKQALRLRSGQATDTEEVDIEDLKVGDIVLVKPGEKVPADGIIIKGAANFNEALISGESKPIKHGIDADVVAGSICIDGSVQVKLMRVGENSTIGQIKTLISEAKMTKPTAQTIADKAAGILTFVALTVAIVALISWSFIFGESLVFGVTIAITVLVIACPHALGLAIPTVSTIATRLAVDNGLFIKDMKKLEIIRKVDTVVFDKTGTLTKGDFSVTKININKNSNLKINKFIEIAASLEKHSSHLIGMSIVKYAKSKKIKLANVSKFKNIAGKGVEGIVNGKKYFIGKYKNTPIALVSNEEIIGEIILSDEIKPESKRAIERLHEMGIKTAMLTGDNEKIAKEVAEKLNLDEYFANVMPADKYKKIKELQGQIPGQARDGKAVVLMIGDGVNDAPALTQADVGVAIGAGTDVAVEAGDVVLIKNNPEDVVALVKLSKKVYRKMIENLTWALGYNIVAIPAAAGLFIPWGFQLRPEVGAFLMSMSSVIVVINAMTLKKVVLK